MEIVVHKLSSYSFFNKREILINSAVEGVNNRIFLRKSNIKHCFVVGKLATFADV